MSGVNKTPEVYFADISTIQHCWVVWMSIFSRGCDFPPYSETFSALLRFIVRVGFLLPFFSVGVSIFSLTVVSWQCTRKPHIEFWVFQAREPRSLWIKCSVCVFFSFYCSFWFYFSSRGYFDFNFNLVEWFTMQRGETHLFVHLSQLNSKHFA